MIKRQSYKSIRILILFLTLIPALNILPISDTHCVEAEKEDVTSVSETPVYDPQPTTMEEVRAAIDAHEAEYYTFFPDFVAADGYGDGEFVNEPPEGPDIRTVFSYFPGNPGNTSVDKAYPNVAIATRDLTSQFGAMWSKEKLDLDLPFSTEMYLHLGHSANPADTRGEADGMTFTMHNYSSALTTMRGGRGEGLGVYKGRYSGGSVDGDYLPYSVVIEFDTYRNIRDGHSFVADPTSPDREQTAHCSLLIPRSGATTADPILENEHMNTHFFEPVQDWVKFEIAWMPDYNGSTLGGTLTYTFNGVESTYSIPNVQDRFNGTSVWWGFTGATGAQTAVQAAAITKLPEQEYDVRKTVENKLGEDIDGGTASAGVTLSYTIRVESPAAFSSIGIGPITIIDKLSEYLDHGSVSEITMATGASGDTIGTSITIPAGQVDIRDSALTVETGHTLGNTGDWMEISFSIKIKDDTEKDAIIYNTAILTSEELEPKESNTTEVTITNGSGDETEVTAAKTAGVNGGDVDNGIEDDPVPVNIGDEIEYTITIHNPEGPASNIKYGGNPITPREENATNIPLVVRNADSAVTVTDAIPDGLTIIEIGQGGMALGNTVTWELAELPYGKTNLTVKARVDREGLYVNEAAVDIEGHDKIKTNKTYHEAESGPVFHFIKTDAATDKPLPGAVFKLYLWKGSGDAPDEIVPADLTGTGWEFAGTCTSADGNGSTILGEVKFTGLTKGEYRLVEVKTPEGYQLPLGQWRFAVDGGGTISFRASVGRVLPPAFQGKGTAGSPYIVGNIAGYKLPVTGGGGTFRLAVLGGVLLTGGLLLMLGYRRRRQKSIETGNIIRKQIGHWPQKLKLRKEETKMFKLKKITALLLVFLFAFGITPVVLAEDENPALIEPSRLGSITIHKFDDTGTSEAGVLGKAGDGTELDTTDFGNPLGGVTFKVTLIPSATANTTVVQAQNIISLMDETELAANQRGGTTAGGSGMYKFGDLVHGIYLVEEVENPATDGTCSPFLVSIPMTNPTDHSSWLYDIHAYPKNVLKEGKVDKKILNGDGEKQSSITANIGDEVSWVITSTFPGPLSSIQWDDEDAGYFFVMDGLDTRLNFMGVKVELVCHEGGREELTVEEGHYNLTSPGIGTPGTGESNIVIDFKTKDGLEKLGDAHLEDTVEITVKTVVNETAVTNLANPILNGVKLYFNNENGDPNDPDPPLVPTDPDPEVDLLGIAIKKVDEKGELLNGTTFTIYKTENNAKAGEAIQLNGSDWKETSGSSFAVVGSDPVAYLKGYIYFSGEALDELGLESAAGTKYYFVETKAPSGYDLLNHIFELKCGTTTTITNAKIPGFILPITGGSVTLLFTIVGILMIGGAITLFIISKKRKRSKRSY